MTAEEWQERRKQLRENAEARRKRLASMTPEERRKQNEEVMDWLDRVPVIPKNVRGIKYSAPCACGGTITAVREKINGHMRASCDKCGMRMIE